MYQFIVLSLGFLLLFGGAYLINKDDKDGILQYAFSKDMQVLPSALALETLTGKYYCDKKHGCDNTYVLNFSSEYKVDLEISFADGVEQKTESGTWKIENGNIISILLTDSSSEGHFEIPKTFLIQSVSTRTLSKISYDKEVYFDMNKPTFVKQISQEESQ